MAITSIRTHLIFNVYCKTKRNMFTLKIVIICCVLFATMNAIASQPVSNEKDEPSPSEDVESDEEQQKFYEVDAFGDDYLDFGAITGPKGSFSWHANYPLEK